MPLIHVTHHNIIIALGGRIDLNSLLFRQPDAALCGKHTVKTVADRVGRKILPDLAFDPERRCSLAEHIESRLRRPVMIGFVIKLIRYMIIKNGHRIDPVHGIPEPLFRHAEKQPLILDSGKSGKSVA